MKKIINCADPHANRPAIDEDMRLGIIFPNATGGHFLYSFYSPEPVATLANCKLDKYGTAHDQIRIYFDFFTYADDKHIKPDAVEHRKSGKRDFLSHYYSDQATRITYPHYFLICIQPSPETLLLHTFMMLFKTLVYQQNNIFSKSLQDQYIQSENFLNHLKRYNYLDWCNLKYTTREIYYDKTVNPRVIEYRRYNRRYVDKYINYFETLREYFSADFEQQFNFEKDFLDKYRDKLYI